MRHLYAPGARLAQPEVYTRRESVGTSGWCCDNSLIQLQVLSMRRAIVISLVLSALPLWGAQYTGSVRAADQFVPGATVTAQQGATKVTAFTDENGRYSMDLGPGVWDIRVEMFGFTEATGKVDMGD